MQQLEVSHVEFLLQDFQDVMGKDAEALENDAEYMRVTELKFLLANIRAQIDIQLFQGYSKTDTVTFDIDASAETRLKEHKNGRAAKLSASDDATQSDIVLRKRTSHDSELLSQRLGSLDEIILSLKAYVDKRLTITRSHQHGARGRGKEATKSTEQDQGKDLSSKILTLPRILRLCEKLKFRYEYCRCGIDGIFNTFF